MTAPDEQTARRNVADEPVTGGGQPARLAAMGWQAFTAAVRAAVPDWGGKRAWRPIAVRVFDALTGTEGVRTGRMHVDGPSV